MSTIKSLIMAMLLSMITVQAQAGWGAWTSMGGSYTEDPDLCTELPSGGRAHLVARGSDGAIWWRQWDGSGWSAPMSLGGSFKYSPTVTCRFDRVDVFGVNQQNQILWKTYSHARGQWTNWRPVYNISATSAPAAVIVNSSNIYLYVRASDGHIWTATSNNEQFNAWRNLGGVFLGKPSASVYHRDANTFAITIVGQGTDRQTYYIHRQLRRLGDDVYGSRWSEQPPVITSAPEITYYPGQVDRADYFGRNEDNTLGHAWRDPDSGRISQWESLGGIMASGPGAVWVTPRQLLVTMRGNDNALYYRVFNR